MKAFGVEHLFHDNYVIYPLDKFKESFEVIELKKDNAWLILKKEDFWFHFACVQFFMSDGDDTNVMVSVIFHGDGPSDVLRECRHTYWGDPSNSGYIFYPDGRIISAAFKELSKYFDEMTEETS